MNFLFQFKGAKRNLPDYLSIPCESNMEAIVFFHDVGGPNYEN